MIVHPFEITDIREVDTKQADLKLAHVIVTIKNERFKLDYYYKYICETKGKSGFTENHEFLRFIRCIPNDDVIVILLSWLSTHLILGHKLSLPKELNDEIQTWEISDERERSAHRARLDYLREHGLEK